MAKQQNMYFLLVLLTFAAYTEQQLRDPQFMEKWKKYRADCGTQEGVDLAEAQKAWETNHFPDDKKLKCFYKCINEKLGVIDPSGEVVDDKLGAVAAEFNNAATAAEIVAECGPLKGADLCETAYKLIACIKAAILD